MKLYVWYAPNSLEDYGSGIAFAYAETKEQAMDEILSSDSNDRLMDDLLTNEPTVYTNAIGFAIRGSS
jgi:hypothetical protein